VESPLRGDGLPSQHLKIRDREWIEALHDGSRSAKAGFQPAASAAGKFQAAGGVGADADNFRPS
jgi:hypothetical protein